MNTTVVCCICDSTVISPVTLSAGLDFYIVCNLHCSSVGFLFKSQHITVFVSLNWLLTLRRTSLLWYQSTGKYHRGKDNPIRSLWNLIRQVRPFILAKLREDLSNLKYLVTDCCKRWLREDKSLTSHEIFFTCSAILDFNYFSDKTPSLPVVYLMIVLFVCCQFTGFPFMVLSLLVVVWGCGVISRLSVYCYCYCYNKRSPHCYLFVCLFFLWHSTCFLLLSVVVW